MQSLYSHGSWVHRNYRIVSPNTTGPGIDRLSALTLMTTATLLPTIYFSLLPVIVVAMIFGPRFTRVRPDGLDQSPKGRWAPLDTGLTLVLILIAGAGYWVEAGPEKPTSQVEIKPHHLIAGMAIQAQLVTLLWLYFKVIRNVPFNARLWLGRPQVTHWIRYGVITLLVTMVAMHFASWLVQWWLSTHSGDSDQMLVQAFQANTGHTFRILVILAAGVVSPIYEEMIYRGIIHGVMRERTGQVFATLASSAVFALAHQTLIAGLPLFILAAGLSIAYERTRSLAVPILMHSLFNLWNLACMVVATTSAS